MRKNVFYFLFLALLLGSCDAIPHEIRVEGQYQLTIPSSMRAVDDLDEKASLQYANFGKEIYFTLNQIPRAEVKKTLGEAAVTTDSLLNLETYAKFISSTFKYTVSADAINLKSKGEFFYLEFIGEIPEAKLYYQLLFAADEEYFYQLIAWTLADRKSLYEEDLKAILESFELL
jgi:bifunctional DNA-binding transcriptional regulator/antitoxin component of YhaV-PrlF toxin-antitoxin module